MNKTMTGTIIVEAKNLEEAIEKANEKTMEIIGLQGAFLDFKVMLAGYAVKNATKMDKEVLDAALKISKMSCLEGAAFIIYILQDWNAYAMDIINGKYSYINLTDMIYHSWLEDLNK